MHNPYLSSAHRPLIEGLFHGGAAQTMRRALTAFGSGWRGILKTGAAEMKALGLGNAFGGASTDTAFFKSAFEGSGSKLKTGFNQMLQRAEQTGYQGIFVHEQTVAEMAQARSAHKAVQQQLAAYQGGGRGAWNRFTKKGQYEALLQQEQKLKAARESKFSDLKTSIRHERIHEAHGAAMSQGGKPVDFVASELEKHSKLESVLAQRGKSDSLPFYRRSMAADPENAAWTDATERLAYGNEADRSFFRRAGQAGIADPRTVHARNLAVARLQLRASEGHAIAAGLSRPINQLRSSRTACKSL